MVSVLNVKALVCAFNQEKALVGAFSVIVQPVVEPMEHYTALVLTKQCPARGYFMVLLASSAMVSPSPAV